MGHVRTPESLSGGMYAHMSVSNTQFRFYLGRHATAPENIQAKGIFLKEFFKKTTTLCKTNVSLCSNSRTIVHFFFVVVVVIVHFLLSLKTISPTKY